MSPGAPDIPPPYAAPRGGAGELAAALLVVAATIAFTGVWMERGGWFGRPPTVDASWTRTDAQRILNAWRDDGFVAAVARAHDRLDAAHPPLLPATAAVVARVLGRDVDTFVCWIAVQPFVALLLLATRRAARRAAGPRVALAATLLTATAPVVLVNARPFYPQLATAALACAAWDALARSDRFARLGPSLAFGFWGALACLTKSIAPVYLVGGVLAAVVGALRRGGAARPAAHGAAALAVVAALAGPWWILNHDVVTRYADLVVGDFGQRLYSGSASLADVGRWTYYPLHFANAGAGLGVALGIVTGATALLLARRGPLADARRGLAAIAPSLWSTLGAWLLLSYGQISGQAYYVLGLVPPLATVAATAAAAAPRGLRAALVVLLVAGAAANVAFSARDPASDDAAATVGPFVLGQRTDPLFGAYALYAGVDPRRDRETWPNEAFVAEMLRCTAEPKPVVVESAFNMYCGRRPFEWEAVRLRREIEVWTPDERQLLNGEWDAVAPRLRAAEFLLVHRQAIPFFPTVAQCEAFARSLGLESEIVAEAQVTPAYGATLLKVGRPGRLGGAVLPAAAVARPGFRAVEADHVAGWGLRGLAVAAAPEGGALWTLFFAPPPDAPRPAEADLVLTTQDGKTERRTRPLVAAPPALRDARAWFATTFEFPAAFGAADVAAADLGSHAPPHRGLPPHRAKSHAHDAGPNSRRIIGEGK